MAEAESRLSRTLKKSENVVERVIEERIILVPLVSGIGDLEDELYSLNETGKAIWDRLDGQMTLRQIAEHLSTEFDVAVSEAREDVSGFVAELEKRKMVVDA